MNNILKTFSAGLFSMESTTYLGDKTLALLPGRLALTQLEAPQFIGVTVDLPSGMTAATLIEAVRIGGTPLAEALKLVQAMTVSGPGPSRRRLMDEALAHLNDFKIILLGCQAAAQEATE